MKVMIDTNIVLDVLLEREPFFVASYAVMKLSATQKIEGFISAAAATDIHYLLKRSQKDETQAKQSMEKLLQLVGVAGALGEDIYAALASNMSDFEDALVAAIAERCQMAYIITRDIKHFAISPVKAVSPEEFLECSAGVDIL